MTHSDNRDFTFPAQVTNIVDGDTLDVRIDLGFEMYTIERVRLDGIDTAEIYGVEKDTEEYERGMKQLKTVEEWVETARDEYAGEWPFMLYSHEYERGAYGRVIGQLEAVHSRVHLVNHLSSEYPDVRE